MRVLAAHDDGAVFSHEPHELGERGLDLLDARIMIEMVGLDVGHDDDIRVEIEKRAVGLVSLGDEILARAVLAVGVVALDDTPDQEARVEAHAIEHRGAHGGRRGLAMRAGDGDGRVAVTERGEHLRAGPHGDAQLPCANEFGIRIGNRGGHDDDVRLDLVDRGGLMPDMHLDAGSRELADIARGLEVGAGDGIAAFMKHEGDAAHAGTADTDEVGALELGRGSFDLGICHMLVYSLSTKCL